MAGGKRFSFGAHLFGFLPADDCSEPQEYAPESWLEPFVSVYADSEVFSGLFRASPSGRDWVLQRAPHAQLKFGALTDVYQNQWQAALLAMQQALVTRGARRTTLTSGDCPDYVVQQLPTALSGLAGRAITAAKAHSMDYPIGDPSQRMPSTAFVAQVAQHCPNLDTLTLSHCICEFPPPPQLSSLKHLTVTTAHERFATGEQQAQRVCRSITPYVPQVTHLAVCHNSSEHIYWPQFYPLLLTQAAPHLVDLHTTCELTDEYVGLLLRHAPALRRLAVKEVAVQTDQHRDRDWGVATLAVDERVSGDKLARLPRSQSGELRVKGRKRIEEYQRPFQSAWRLAIHLKAASAQGLDPHVLERMPTWQFSGARYVTPSTDDNISPEQQDAARRALLQQLSALRAPGATLQVGYGRFALAWLPLLAAALPDLLRWQLRLQDGLPLSGELLAALTGLPPATAPALAFKSFELQSDQYADTPWPWDGPVTVTEFDVACVTRLPDPVGVTRTIQCERLMIKSSVQQAGLEATLARLQHLHFVPIPDSSQFHAYVKYDVDMPPETFVAQLAVLRSVRIGPHKPRPAPARRRRPADDRRTAAEAAGAAGRGSFRHGSYQPAGKRNQAAGSSTATPAAWAAAAAQAAGGGGATSLAASAAGPSQPAAPAAEPAQPSFFSLFLIKLPLNHQIMAALKALPHMSCPLGLGDCTWPLEPSEYTQLGQCVPVSYPLWYLDIPNPWKRTKIQYRTLHTDWESPLLASVCEGVDKGRSGRGLPRLKIKGSGWGLTPRIGKVGDHVSVSSAMGTGSGYDSSSSDDE